jgi:membrane-associated phospholipid phosphatase
MVLGWGSVALVYFGVGWLEVSPAVIPQVWLDRQLPFTVHAIWVYLSFFLLIPYTYCTVVPQRLTQLRVAMQIAAVVSGLFFVILPTSLSYPPVVQQGVSAQLLLHLIAVDSPNNCFPSLHASLTVICILVNLNRQNLLRSIGFLLAGIAILLSIIMLRRHLTIDVGGGMVVGVLSCLAAQYLTRDRIAPVA